MGRYITGDFEYKFMFAVQPSSDIELFGGKQYNTDQLYWHWQQDDLPKIKMELKELNKQMKETTNHTYKYWAKKLDKKNYITSTSDDETQTKKWSDMLEIFARIELGNTILKAVEDQGDVYVQAEY
jgi:hypothetical protein|tara:strand:+ start:2089 stop:2466 length:378 start_codon:yes stop_codon:yes gene_type:complete